MELHNLILDGSAHEYDIEPHTATSVQCHRSIVFFGVFCVL